MSAIAEGTLYLVSCPIGNPHDLSPRAAATLRMVDLVLAEDTRSAQRLLASAGIERRTRSCFDANEPARAEEAALLLRRGGSVAVLSEAGTPTLSDPGYRIVAAAIAAGARVVPVPGPSALLAALVASGLPTDRFLYLGFPPRRQGARRKLLAEVQGLPVTLVLYESPHRVGATLADLAAVLGAARPACLARELTKTHEEFVRGTVGELAHRYAGERPLGEITIVVGGAEVDAGGAPDPGDLRQRAAALLASGMSARDAASALAGECGRPRREMYRLAIEVRGR